jgi:hypothetical protein
VPGVLAFVETFEAERPVADVRASLLRDIVPRLTIHGYELVEQDEGRLELELAERSLSVLVLALATFPIGGFLLLLLKRRTRVRMVLEPIGPERSRVTISGKASLRVRRAFAELRP